MAGTEVLPPVAPSSGGGDIPSDGIRWSAPISSYDARIHFHVPAPPAGAAAWPSPPPVVVLCGWLGAPPSHLAKYAAVYAARGVATAALTAPTGVILALHPEPSQQAFAVAALTALVDAAAPGGGDGAPLIGRSGLAWHAFSSGGAYVLRAISTLVWGTGSAGVRGAVSPLLPPRVRAAVVATAVGGALDSAPAPMDVEAGVKGFSLAAWGSVTGWRPAAVRAVFSAYAAVQAAVVGDVAARYWADMRRLYVGGARGVARLAVFYSTADVVLDGGGVDALEGMISATGAVGWRVDGAAHVQLGRVYPAEYAAAVERTVLAWLRGWREGAGAGAPP